MPPFHAQDSCPVSHCVQRFQSRVIRGGATFVSKVAKLSKLRDVFGNFQTGAPFSTSGIQWNCNLQLHETSGGLTAAVEVAAK